MFEPGKKVERVSRVQEIRVRSGKQRPPESCSEETEKSTMTGPIPSNK